jgi:hypothetical protein
MSLDDSNETLLARKLGVIYSCRKERHERGRIQWKVMRFC